MQKKHKFSMKKAIFLRIFSQILSRKAKGLSEKTITSYQHHFRAISKHIDINIPIDSLDKFDLERMIASMNDVSKTI